MNKVLIKLYVPTIEENFDIMIPKNIKIGQVIKVKIIDIDLNKKRISVMFLCLLMMVS